MTSGVPGPVRVISLIINVDAARTPICTPICTLYTTNHHIRYYLYHALQPYHLLRRLCHQQTSGIYHHTVYQQCSDIIRQYGTQGKIIYDAAHEEWKNDPSSLLVEPPRDDQEKTTEYFRTCDLCAIKPKNVHE